jgi:hypothetical protein
VAELDTTSPDGSSTWQRSPQSDTSDVFMLASRSLVLLRDTSHPTTESAERSPS